MDLPVSSFVSHLSLLTVQGVNAVPVMAFPPCDVHVMVGMCSCHHCAHEVAIKCACSNHI